MVNRKDGGLSHRSILALLSLKTDNRQLPEKLILTPTALLAPAEKAVLAPRFQSSAKP
jgi:hypothetical protein